SRSAGVGKTPPGSPSLQLHPAAHPSPVAVSAHRTGGPPSVRAEGTETTGIVDLPDPRAPVPPANVSLALQPRPSQRGPPIALCRKPPRQLGGNRDCEFIELRESAVTLLIGGSHIQLSSTPNPLIPTGQSLTLKGVTSF